MLCKQMGLCFQIRLFLFYKAGWFLYEMTCQSTGGCKVGVSAMLYRNTIDLQDRLLVISGLKGEYS
jgi:hypothetical protein